ncbi:MAG: protein phosphatase 2C domain-containing protein, partial [Actinomycetota bacterium]
LGDGDILNAAADGEVTKPLPEDARLLANETTSMCLPKAENDFRFSIQMISAEQSPAMILLSTDGYLNSFSSEAGFFQAATDILEMLRAEDGFNDVNINLKAWLEEATRMGSGDDSTVAVIYRPDALKKTKKIEPLEKVETTITETPAKEVSQAIALLTNSETLAPEDLEDVTVTITFKKDKNKISKTASAALAKIDSGGAKLKDTSGNKTDELDKR